MILHENIHDFEKTFKREIEKVKESDMIPGNKELLLEFKDYLLSENIGYAKIAKYMLEMRKFSSVVNKDYGKVEEKDVRAFVSYLSQNKYSETTKKEFKVVIRKFYKHLRSYKKKGQYPPEVEWITLTMPNNSKIMPEELITEEEAIRMIQHAENLRDKTLIAVLAESGARISEIGNLKLKHVSFEKYGSRLNLHGKTGGRKILVISSMPYLQQWMNQHPKNDNPDAFLWYNPKGNLICYQGLAAILKKSARRAGIKKRIYPHLFRHSRATQFAASMSESAMKQYFGWTQSSKMAGIYVHMSGKETDELILRVNGIEVNKEMKELKIRSRTCLRCTTINEATNKFCKMCSFALDSDAQKEILLQEQQRKDVDNLMSKILQDKDVLAIIAQKIRELTLSRKI